MAHKRIMVNGRVKEIAGDSLTYEQIMELADTGRRGLHSIAAHWPRSLDRRDVIVAPGESVEVVEGMHIAAMVTDNA